MKQEKREEGGRGNLLTFLFFVVCFLSFFGERALKNNETPSLPFKNKTQKEKLHLNSLSQTPLIYSIPNLLTLEECDYLIEYAKNQLKRSTVFSQTGEMGPKIDSGRSSSGTWITSRPKIVQKLEERLSEVTNIPISHGESLHILKYKEGEEYQPHYDWFDEKAMKEMMFGGQRVITVLIYLQTPEEGGETTFPEINLKVPPLKGSGVLFYNLDVNGEKDKSSLHASVPVMKGEKWAAVKWLREYDRGYGQEEWDW